MQSKNNANAVSAGIGYTIGNLLIKGMVFFSLPIFTRILSPEDYGIVNTYTAYTSILCILLGLSLHSSMRAAKLKFKDLRIINKYVSSLLIVYGITIFIGIVSINILAQYVKFFSEINNIYLLDFLIFDGIFSAIILLYNGRIGLEYLYKQYLKISFFLTIGNIVCSLFFIEFVFNSNRYFGKILGAFIPTSIVVMYILYFLCKKERPRFNIAFLKFGVKYSIPLIPHGLSLIILAQFDRVMIQNFIGNYAAGIYSLACNVGIILQIISQSLDSSWGVWFFESMQKKSYHLILEKTMQYIALFTFITIGLITISPEVITIMTSIEFWESKKILVVVLWDAYFSFLYLVIVHYEYYYNKTYLILIGTVMAAVVNVSLNYYAIPRYGYIAAAYATMISYMLNYLFHYVVIKFLHKEKFLNMIETLLYIIIVLILGAIVMLFKDECIYRYISFGLFSIVLYKMNEGGAKKGFFTMERGARALKAKIKTIINNQYKP